MSSQYDNDSRAKGREDWSGIRFILTRRLLAVLLALAGLALFPPRAQPAAAKATPPAERCLLIVETSKSMQRRTDGVLNAVQDLLGSRLKGEFRDGCTLGIWTFNEDLSAGHFPLQTWSSSAQKGIIERALSFLKGQKYEKQANFDKVVPALSRVIQDSELITVILISSGDGKIRGTPFDGPINETHQRYHSQQQKARMPFVTVLRARQGQVTACVVNTSPSSVQVPRWSQNTNSVETSHDKLLEALHKASSPTAPALIIPDKRPQPERAAAPMPEVEVAKPEAPPAVAAVTATNAPVLVTPPAAAAPAVVIATADPAPVVSEKPATESPPKPAPQSTPVSEPKSEEVKAPEAMPAEPTPEKPAAVPSPPVPELKPEPVNIEQLKPNLPPEVKTEPAPAPVASRESPPAAAPVATAAQSVPLRPSSLEPPPPSRPAPPVQTAAAVPAEALVRRSSIWMVAGLLVVVAVGFAFLLLRRSHAAPTASLITRSIEREKKP